MNGTEQGKARGSDDAASADAPYTPRIGAAVDRALFPVMAALLAHLMAVDKSFEENER